MHRYFIKIPWIVKQLFSSYYWDLPSAENAVYLTFDDGPHPTITPWVLDELKKAGVSASFFCIGKNVKQYPEIYQRILDEGHAVGNHTQHHLNGWTTSEEDYLKDVALAAKYIDSNLFRPPYGRLRSRQAKGIPKAMNKPEARIIMWDVLSADFDPSFSPQQCLSHVTDNTKAGSIIVFHDSEKAYENLFYVLPAAIGFLRSEGYILKKIEM